MWADKLGFRVTVRDFKSKLILQLSHVLGPAEMGTGLNLEPNLIYSSG